MKLTISSNSMLKPLFLMENTSQEKRPPDRMLGLLTLSTDRTQCCATVDKVLEYCRPDAEHVMLSCARWPNFLSVTDEHANHCVAVFGFHFDGQHTWYQVWNSDKERVSWIMHIDHLVYQPLAIVAMDALVTLMPNWHGKLYQYPGDAQLTNPFSPITIDRIDEQDVHRLVVSDASINLSGDLWFLVTVKTADGACSTGVHASHSQRSRTGWISTGKDHASTV